MTQPTKGSGNIVTRALAYWQDGTLLSRVKRRLRRQTEQAPAQYKVHWYGADSDDEAAQALVEWGADFAGRDGGWVLCPGAGDAFHERVADGLSSAGVEFLRCGVDGPGETTRDASRLAAVICAFRDTRSITRCATAMQADPRFCDAPFEYAEGVDDSRRRFEKWDDCADTSFVSPVLLDDPDPYDIYEESLEHCELKTNIRDYLDLYQALKSLGQRGIEGSIVEFGSYRGHSGWLIARTLEALGQERRVFMFDAFESFPVESRGIDQFWSDTHPVDFDSVKQRLAPFPNVTLVQGDFTQTLSETDVGAVALAYVDCDSYRATRYLLGAIADDLLVPGGVMTCEDYGHSALLGSRVAVHEVLDGRTDLTCFYSQFSGLYFAVKTAT